MCMEQICHVIESCTTTKVILPAQSILVLKERISLVPPRQFFALRFTTDGSREVHFYLRFLYREDFYTPRIDDIICTVV